MKPDPAPSSRNVEKNPRTNRSVVTETTQGSISSTTSASDGRAVVITLFASSPVVLGLVSVSGEAVGVGGTGVYVGSGVGLGSGGGSSPQATAARRKKAAITEMEAQIHMLARMCLDDFEPDA